MSTTPPLPPGNGGRRNHLNNGERLQFRIGDKSIGMSVANLGQVLFVILIGVFLWASIENNRESLGRLTQQQGYFAQTQQQSIQDTRDLVARAREGLSEMQRGQAMLLGQVRQECKDMLEAQGQALAAQIQGQTETIRRWFSIHQFNQVHDQADWIPLEVSPPEAPPTERRR